MNKPYLRNAQHPDPFHPDHPDPLGALREAAAWVMQPLRSDATEIVYSADRYDALTAMLRRAIAQEEELHREIMRRAARGDAASVRRWAEGFN